MKKYLMEVKMKDELVCVGGGTGLAPFVSFAQHLHAVE